MQAVLEVGIGEDLIMCSGASAMEFQLSSLFVNSCCCCCTGVVRVPRERGTSIVGTRYQKLGEETTDWEDLQNMRHGNSASVNCK